MQSQPAGLDWSQVHWAGSSSQDGCEVSDHEQSLFPSHRWDILMQVFSANPCGSWVQSNWVSHWQDPWPQVDEGEVVVVVVLFRAVVGAIVETVVGVEV